MKCGYAASVAGMLACALLAQAQDQPAPIKIPTLPTPVAQTDSGPVVTPTAPAPSHIPHIEPAPADHHDTCAKEHPGVLPGLLDIFGHCHHKCGPASFWVTPEYMYWWTKQAQIPFPLVTTGVLSDTTFFGISAGDLRAPNTQVLLGPGNVGRNTQPGMSLTMGMWLDEGHLIGLEGRGFFLADSSFRYSFSGDANGVPFLAFPFFDTIAGQEAAAPVSVPFPSFINGLPGIPFGSTGAIDITGTTKIWGAEANAVISLTRGPCCYVEGLLGYRHFELEDTFNVYSRTRDFSDRGGFNVLSWLGNPLPAASTTESFDRFSAQNIFDGGQVGLRGAMTFGQVVVTGSGKVALGVMRQTLRVSGNSRATFGDDGHVETAAGGFWALPSNSGTFSRSQFAVIPELQVKVGYKLTEWLRPYIGYQFLYVSSVARAAEQLDRNRDSRQDPRTFIFTGERVSQPQAQFHTTDFVAHGLLAGIELRW